MWGWIEPLLAAILSYLDKKAAEPKTLEDVKTPQNIRDKFRAAIRDRLNRMRSDKGVGN